MIIFTDLTKEFPKIFFKGYQQKKNHQLMNLWILNPSHWNHFIVSLSSHSIILVNILLINIFYQRKRYSLYKRNIIINIIIFIIFFDLFSFSSFQIVWLVYITKYLLRKNWFSSKLIEWKLYKKQLKSFIINKLNYNPNYASFDVVFCL